MQMILVEHLLGFADDGSATLIDFHSPTTFKQLLRNQTDMDKKSDNFNNNKPRISDLYITS